MSDDPLSGGLQSRLRAIYDTMDADVARALADLGVSDYRTRFSAVVRTIAANGPSTIRALAERLRVTHSAASQTAAEMQRRGLVELVPGSDARERRVHLTDLARELLPRIDAEWDATAAAATALDAELSVPLEQIIAELEAALRRRPFRVRIADAAGRLDGIDPAHRAALTGLPQAPTDA